MKTILVTGGAGYIGSHTCKALKLAGFLPVVYDNLSTGHRKNVRWGPLVEGDLLDRERLSAAFVQYRPIGVLHFAASALVVESMHNPGLYYRNNVGGSLSLLEAMQAHGVPYLVFSSTCATYGVAKTAKITEEHPQEPINPYGRSKLMVETMIRDFEKIHGIKSVILRYFNAAGADGDGEIGEDHTPETHLIPLVLQTAQGKRKEIVVYGTDFASPDGSAVRDYIHVEDLSDAHVRALQHLLRGQDSLAVNLGSGEGSSVFEIIRAVERVHGKSIHLRKAEKREGEPAVLIADNAMAKRVLGWEPKRSHLPLIIESAWRWHQSLCCP